MYYYFKTGGPLMCILFVISIISMGIILERIAYFFMKEKKISNSFKDKLIKEISNNNFDKAAQLCDGEKNTISDIIKEFLLRFNSQGDIHHFNQLVKEIVLEKVEVLENRLYILGIIGYVAPMLGLLGTVTGMIQSFKSLASQGVGDPAIVASGISKALFTTAAGLSIAIPAIVMFNFFNKRIEKIETDTDKMLTGIINLIRTN